jgi:RNA polymerase sigma-70 factor (ECF subfamily)
VTEDRELVRAVLRSGDEAAFRALYRRHTPALYRLALRLGGGDEPWAGELVQRAWIRAVEGLGTFGWRSGLFAWLGGIAVNCARELWREGRGREDALDEQEHEAPASRGSQAGVEDRIDLDRAIERLPLGYRRVFVLHDVEGYTHEEIGGLLGIEAGTSKSQLSHARRRLRASLEPPASWAGRRDVE